MTHFSLRLPRVRFVMLAPCVISLVTVLAFGSTPASAQRPALRPGIHERSMMIDGTTRRYRIHVPQDADKPNGLPVVVLLHGLGVDGETVAEATEMDKQSEAEGYLLVCPDAAGPEKRWNTGGPDPEKGLADDVKFLTRLIAVLKRTVQVDPRRVYMVGYSSGATMSFRMALTIPEELAAIVPVTSTPEREWMKQTSNAKAVPLMLVAGEQDTHTPYKQQPKPPISRLTVRETIDAWVRMTQCKAQPTVRSAENGGVTIEEFAGSTPLSRVTLLTVHRSAHDWPGTTIKQRAERPDLHGIVLGEIWRFCRRQVR